MVAALLAACVRFPLAPGSASPDGAADARQSNPADSAADARQSNPADSAADKRSADLAGPSWPTTPFGNISPVSAFNTTGVEDDLSLPDDELECFFNRNETQVWTAKRASTSEAWGAPQPVSELNGQMEINTPQISADGLTLFFAQQKVFDIYVVHRATRSSAWGTATKVNELNTTAGDGSPFATPDLLFLAFSSNRDGTYDLFQATRLSTSAGWSDVKPMTELNSFQDDEDPWLNADKTIVYFDSTRSGGKGQLDIWMATRSSSSATFGTPVPVTELNSSAIDGDPWISRDGRRLYFSSERNGSRDIFSASR